MDEDDPMDLDRAETVAKVAQVIVNTAKVEVDFMKQTGHGGTAFIQGSQTKPLSLAPAIPIDVVKQLPEEQLCQQCQLPECDDASQHCLVKIQRKAAA